MRLQIQIPDSVYDAYTNRASEMSGNGKVISPEEVIADILDRFSGVSPTDRVIVVGNTHRQRLEKLLSGGGLFDAEDLTTKVEGLASISVGDIRLEFTPGQLKQLAHFARRNGKTVEEVTKETVKRMEWMFFEHLENGGKRG